MKRVSSAEKLYYVREYLAGNGSQQQCADRAGVSKTAFQHWLRKYSTFGEEAFLKKRYGRYPQDVKKAAVEDYRSGVFSQEELCKKYQLSSMRQIYEWNQEYEKSAAENFSFQVRGRSTTWEERVAIVRDCLANDRDYCGIAEKHRVSYQQIYTWVRRYEVGGEEYLHFTKEKIK